jgi:hypothetical protein
MQKSHCCATIRLFAGERSIDLNSFLFVGYDIFMTGVVAVSSPILRGVMHDISKTGLVHAKFRVLGIKRFTECMLFPISVLWVTIRLAHLAPSTA